MSRLRQICFGFKKQGIRLTGPAPGFRLHPLKGDWAGQWSVRVIGNWRVGFRFKDNEAVDVDLIDCH